MVNGNLPIVVAFIAGTCLVIWLAARYTSRKQGRWTRKAVGVAAFLSVLVVLVGFLSIFR